MTDDSPSSSRSLPADALPELVASLVSQHFAQDEREPLRAYRTAQQLQSAFPLELDGERRSWQDTVELLSRVIEVTPSTTSRRFFNQLFGGRDSIALLGEIAAVLTNSPMHTFKASGVQVLLERAVLRRMGAAAGMPDGDGMFAPGGSLSNFAAMMMARNEALPRTRERGMPSTPAAIYTSAASHYSVGKAAAMLGLGREQVRRIPIDARGRMLPQALAAAIARDQAAGTVPVMINATACTTVLGAFDPLPALADVAKEHGVWLHVDAAYGGSILLSPRHRHLLEGCERADSVTWDAHKLLGVPLTCSALLTRRPGQCAAHLDEAASYLFQDDALLDPGRGSIQCARHNDALKLWLSWQHHGDAGLAARIDRLFMLAAHTTARIEAEPRLALSLAPSSINVCFEARGKSSRRLCRALWERSIAKIGHAVVDGREVVRWVFVNPAVETSDIDEVIDQLLATAESLPDEDSAARAPL
ncbi:MAG: aminotransferase class V-fold PLP-dependent enzyme [Deltaproteobacteria bacterium]|nr:aminotransferase class V-fold PLP-dependent enzyme [Deltaproteobacteria bacterium]